MVAIEFGEKGFLWPTQQELINDFEDAMTIIPYGVKGPVENSDDESEMMARRMYTAFKNNREQVLTEIEVMQWMCGGPSNWLEVLRRLKAYVGMNRPVPVKELKAAMFRQGVSETITDLTMLRLVRGGYAERSNLDGTETLTLVRW